MQHQSSHFSLQSAQSPTYSAPGLTVQVRVNGKPLINSEGRARCLVWRDGNILDESITGLVVRRARSGRVVASGFNGFDEVIAAYERGELSRGRQE